MRMLIVLLFALAVAPVLSQTPPTVLTCSSVPAGTLMTPWPNCLSTSYKAAAPGLIVAVQRAGASQWQPSAAILPTDYIFASAAYNGTTSDWWPSTVFTWAITPTGATITFKWTTPITNADGSIPMLPLASYRIYQGMSASNLTTTYTIAVPALTYTTPDLSVGTYYFAITAVGQNGAESAQSSVITATVNPPKPLAAASPGGFVATVNQ
jgi:hypothetical protein